MREVEVDPLDVRVLGDDHAEGCASPTPDIDKDTQILEAGVPVKDFVGDDRGVKTHCSVESPAELRVASHVLERGHSMSHFERYPTFKNCIPYVVSARR